MEKTETYTLPANWKDFFENEYHNQDAKNWLDTKTHLRYCVSINKQDFNTYWHDLPNTEQIKCLHYTFLLK